MAQGQVSKPKPPRPAAQKVPRARSAQMVTVSAPAAKSTRLRTLAPEFIRGPNGSIRVRHREYLTTIIQAVSQYSCQAILPINPGLDMVFPWLSSIAAAFNKYTLHSLRVIDCSDCATTVPGVKIYTFNSDALASAPQTKQQALLLENSFRLNSWDSGTFDIKDFHSLGQEKFIRTVPYYASVPNSAASMSGADLHTYDSGILFIGVSGSSTDVCGDVYIEYDVTLTEPVPPQGRSAFFSAGGSVQAALLNLGLNNWLWAFVSSAKVGDGQIRSNLITIPSNVSLTNSHVFYLPIGQTVVNLEYSATVPVNLTAIPTLTASSVSAVSIISASSSLDTVGGSYTVAYSWLVTVFANNSIVAGTSGDAISITFTNPLNLTTVLAFQLYAFQLAQAS